MAATQQQDEGELSEVNVVPLADVSLVVLIILMMITPMIMQSMIRVQTGKAVAAQAAPQNEPEPPLSVEIKKDGVYLNTVKMNDMLDFKLQLTKALANRLERRVLVTPDLEVTHGFVVEVLDTARQNGAESVALMKKRTS